MDYPLNVNIVGSKKANFDELLNIQMLMSILPELIVIYTKEVCHGI